MSVSAASVGPEPPYAIRTARLTVRAYERSDVRALHEAVRENVEALRPWMPWIAREPLTLQQRAQTVRAIRGRFDLGEDYIYGIFEGDRLVGGCGLHARISEGGLEIGYWTVEDRWSDGIATEAAAALTRVGFQQLRADRLEIRVSPRNLPSLRVPRKLGFVEEGTLRGVGSLHEGVRDDLVVFGMLAHEHGSSAAAGLSDGNAVEGFLPDA